MSKTERKIDNRSHSTSAKGKRIEYFLASQMMKEGLQVYMPLVDDDAVDFVIKRPDGSFVEVQIKASTTDVDEKDAGFFRSVPFVQRDNYWFIFYVEHMEEMWILSSEDFLKVTRGPDQLKKGEGTERAIRLHNWSDKKQELSSSKKMEGFVAKNFKRILDRKPKITQ